MILDATTFINSGLPTAYDISEDEVNFGIKNIEHTIVKPRLGVEMYNNIVTTPASYNEAIKGSTTVGGLELAEENLVFAYLIYNKTRLTRYSTVIKDDEHSSEPSLSDLLKLAKGYWETGLMLLDEVCEFLQTPKPKGIVNDLIFNELIY